MDMTILAERPKRTRISPKVNQKALELCPNSFTTRDFADRAGTSLEASRKFLLRIAGTGKINETDTNCWTKGFLSLRNKPRTMLDEEIAIITEAMDLIQKLIEENRWLKEQVEHWADQARQAKIYFQREEQE